MEPIDDLRFLNTPLHASNSLLMSPGSNSWVLEAATSLSQLREDETVTNTHNGGGEGGGGGLLLGMWSAIQIL